MQSIMKPLQNENGSVIVVAMIMLVLLTLIGISSTTTSTTEVQIAANNQNYQVEFYLADSGWRQGSMLLENLGSAPSSGYSMGDVVKNYGHGTSTDADTSNLKNIAPDNITPDNNSTSSYNVPYWYEILYEKNETPVGYEKGYLQHYYEIESRSNMLKADVGVTAQKINVRASKIYKVGY